MALPVPVPLTLEGTTVRGRDRGVFIVLVWGRQAEFDTGAGAVAAGSPVCKLYPPPGVQLPLLPLKLVFLVVVPVMLVLLAEVPAMPDLTDLPDRDPDPDLP